MTPGKGVGTVRNVRRRAHGDQGAAAVEFALLLPLFLMLCFGSISGGIVFNDKLSLTQGVREAARYGATYTSGGTPNSVASATTFLTEVRRVAKGDTFDQLSKGSVAYCVMFKNATSGTTYYLGDADTNAQVGRCPDLASAVTLDPGTVSVLGTRSASIELIVTRYAINLASFAVARFEGS
jgi:Flp pilus assembly protein TadG